MCGMALLRRKKNADRRSGRMILVHLNARMQPLHRGDTFEDPLDEHLASRGLAATVAGGGTQLTAEGEPESCDIEVEVSDDADLGAVLDAITSFLESRTVPRGSTISDEIFLSMFGPQVRCSLQVLRVLVESGVKDLIVVKWFVKAFL